MGDVLDVPCVAATVDLLLRNPELRRRVLVRVGAVCACALAIPRLDAEDDADGMDDDDASAEDLEHELG